MEKSEMCRPEDHYFTANLLDHCEYSELEMSCQYCGLNLNVEVLKYMDINTHIQTKEMPGNDEK